MEIEDRIYARVVGGDTTKGVIGELIKDFSSEDIRIGSLCTIRGDRTSFLGLISDVSLPGSEIIEGAARRESREEGRSRTARLRMLEELRSRGAFSTKLLITPIAVSRGGEVEQADSFPSYMSPILVPSQEDLSLFYGMPDERKLWSLGYPKLPLGDSEDVEIPIDIEVLARGSFGIFGKSGTGKTYLGNALACYIMAYNKVARPDKPIKLLIFDMHSEYGLWLKDQRGEDAYPGVGQIFDREFLIVTPDQQLGRERGLDSLYVRPEEITRDDIALMADLLGLTKTFVDYFDEFLGIFSNFYGDRVEGMKRLVGVEDPEQAELEKIEKRVGKRLGQGAVNSLRAGRARLKNFFSGINEFIDWDGTKQKTLSDLVDEIVDGERSVIITMGRHGDNKPAYLLIANAMARRLWQEFVDRAIRGEGTRYRLIIFLEEAHKFLNPQTYYLTPFGNIARELRKRGVFLCVIDQRPSQLDEDVRAMLWNYFVMKLTEDSDIDSCTRGLPFYKLFKPIVQWLRRQEALVYGEAVRVPAVVRILDYEKIEEKMRDIVRKIREEVREEVVVDDY